MNKLQFFYFRNANKVPVGCMVFEIENNIVKYQYVSHNPKDTFDRALGREILTNRLSKKSYSLTVEKTNRSAVVKEIMKSVRQNKLAPTRIRKAAKLWLNE